jgi:hypothetical protein
MGTLVIFDLIFLFNICLSLSFFVVLFLASYTRTLLGNPQNYMISKGLGNARIVLFLLWQNNVHVDNSDTVEAVS